jgi:hypothetical protein
VYFRLIGDLKGLLDCGEKHSGVFNDRPAGFDEYDLIGACTSF